MLQLGHAEGEMVLDMFLQWHWKDYVAWIIDCANYDELIIIRKLRISDCVSYEYLIVPIMNNFVHYEYMIVSVINNCFDLEYVSFMTNCSDNE